MLNGGSIQLAALQVATEITEDACNYLLLSAAFHGIPVRILGLDEDDFGADMRATHDLRTNIKLLSAYKYARDLPKQAIIMFVDAFDVIWQRGVDYVHQTYSRNGRPDILMSAESGVWPQHLESKYPALPAGLEGITSRFLNSGGVVGRAGKLADFWGHIWSLPAEKRGINDQATIAEIFCDGNPFNISLDYRSEIFFSRFNAEQLMHKVAAAEGRRPHVDIRQGPSRRCLQCCTSMAMVQRQASSTATCSAGGRSCMARTPARSRRCSSTGSSPCSPWGAAARGGPGMTFA